MMANPNYGYGNNYGHMQNQYRPPPSPTYHTSAVAGNLNQTSFQEIKTRCQRSRILYEDESFPANDSSVFMPGGVRTIHRIVWRRPTELVQKPKFFADGVSRHDVIQGELGNCWFIAAVANLTIQKNYFYQVVPQDNTFNPGEYCGAFHFRFWQYGEWIEVVVDDRLPCNSHGEILYMHSQDKGEFWSALLEKAYAKLHGSYESLAGGSPSDAMQDFTGGIIELIDVKESGRNLFKIVQKAFSRQSLMTCALSNSKSGYREEKTATGLVRGHAYSITAVQEIRLNSRFAVQSGSNVQLVRVRNPWGDYFEWNGSWSDSSREWDMVDPSVKASMEYSRRSDGEFWMSIQDLVRQFDHLEICHSGPNPVNTDSSALSTQEWDKVVISGTWTRGSTAGGCINNHDSYARNPQYMFNFQASDEDGDGNKCTVVVSLIQKEKSRTDRRKFGRKDTGFHIGFRVYPVPQQFRYAQSSPGQLDSNFFRQNGRDSFSSGSYVDSREVSARFELPPGNYCIVPTTFNPNEEAGFLLRVFSEPQSKPKQFVPPSMNSTSGIGWNLGLDNMFTSKLTLNSNNDGHPPYQNPQEYNSYSPYPSAVPSSPYPGQAPYSGQAPNPGQAPYPGNAPYPGQAQYPGQAPPQTGPEIGWVFDTIKTS